MAANEFGEFVKISKLIKDMERTLKEAKRERDKIEPLVLDLLTELGVTSVKVDGNTIFIHRQLWANAKLNEEGARDYAGACDALVAHGEGEYVETKFNVMKVSSRIRELEEEGAIPEGLRSSLDITEKTGARVRAAPSK